MYKVGICGHFGGNKIFLDGQTVKTKIVTKELQKKFGNDEILIIDTYGGWKKILKQITSLIRCTKRCENIVILPAHNSLRVFAPILVTINKLKKRKLHYIVIGGWLPKFIKKRKLLSICLKKFDYIYVETSVMKRDLEMQGFTNVIVLPNCKDLRILSESDLVFSDKRPFKVCTFSRVMKMKGIEDAVECISEINQKSKKIVYELDIYGQINEEYKDYFDSLRKSFPLYIRYKGVVDFDKSVEVLKNYYALIFPTRFYTEGIPGTIIDAYAAGIPVISSKWQSFEDVIEEGIVGNGYKFGDKQALFDLLIWYSEKPELINGMKQECLNKAKNYRPEQVMTVLFQNL